MKLYCTNILKHFPGDVAWYFIEVNLETSALIKEIAPKRGWGSVKVSAQIGETYFKTSLFPEKNGLYLLPVKAMVRKAEQLSDNQQVGFSFELLDVL